MRRTKPPAQHLGQSKLLCMQCSPSLGTLGLQLILDTLHKAVAPSVFLHLRAVLINTVLKRLSHPPDT